MLEIAADIEHAERRTLNDEVHARPSGSLQTPGIVTYIARLPDTGRGGEENNAADMLENLLARYSVAAPEPAVKHLATTLGSARLRWERHTEYDRFTFVAAAAGDEPFVPAAELALPADWLARMRGEVLVGVHAATTAYETWHEDSDEISRRFFDGNVLIGSRIADDRAVALTDLRIRSDGFGRLLLLNDGMSEAQAGRVMQRLLDIETYRMMALLALPVAQRLMPVLDDVESELNAVGEALVDAGAQQETELLDRITRLAAESQHRQQKSTYRFSASDAYYEIVLQRIGDLREQRLPGLQTFEEFTTRRLTPAVKTYRAVAKRQQSILEQMARATKLLSTRIDIERQRQNQALLVSMDRRAKAQLQLQATVEGLSVAAVTYYLVGLVAALAAAASVFGMPLDKSLVAGISVPLIAAAVYLSMRRIHRRIREEGGE